MVSSTMSSLVFVCKCSVFSFIKTFSVYFVHFSGMLECSPFYFHKTKDNQLCHDTVKFQPAKSLELISLFDSYKMMEMSGNILLTSFHCFGQKMANNNFFSPKC